MQKNKIKSHIICAWCKGIMRLMEGKKTISKEDNISHGICDECKEKQISVLKIQR